MIVPLLWVDGTTTGRKRDTAAGATCAGLGVGIN